MNESKRIFEKYYAELLKSIRNPDVALGLSRSVSANRQKRSEVMHRFPDTPELSREVRLLKEKAIAHLDEFVGIARESLEANRARVYYADTAAEALKIIGGIVGSGKVVVSGKTLTGEELGLRQHLEGLGNEFWETDVAQFIQQLRNERPMHYVFPSLHVTREEVAGLLTGLLGREIPPDITGEVRTIREFLRGKYFQSDIGISGGNVLAADTGSVLMIENEGNIRMVSNVPPVHIVIVGIEKIVPTLPDAFKVAQVIWRYAGFTAPLYLSVVSGPSGTADIENTLVQGSSGPLELHVILLDNGRSRLAKDLVLREALYCIKCGSCLFECPIFQMAAGYYGGQAYFGGVGSVLTAYMGSPQEAAPMAYTCLRCGLCTTMCPLELDTSRLIAELRHRFTGMAKG
jgi:L-lactate dehydrogenase complex protein LldG